VSYAGEVIGRSCSLLAYSALGVIVRSLARSLRESSGPRPFAYRRDEIEVGDEAESV
jgi:hypothetical protein